MDVRRWAAHHWIGVRTSRRAPGTAEQVRKMAEAVQASGGRVVLTNGVFDLLHPGHVEYLSHARALGDVLIVAMNSDRSVRAIKGPARPVTPESERAEILLALASVDAVVVFEENTPKEIIDSVKPDVLVKGSDWKEDEIVGRESVVARGGRVVRIAFRPGYSTTELIRRSRGE